MDMNWLPTLYKLTSTGKVQTWTIGTGGVIDSRYNPEGTGRIETIYGLLGTDSPQQAVEYITEGKNQGKSNETTAKQQAALEAQSQWEKKVKKGYVQNIEDAQDKKIDTNFITGGVEPMLAQSYDKHASKISYPAFVQPKLDGHRCIAIIDVEGCTLWSRTRKPITGVPHIAKQLSEAYSQLAATMPTGQIVLDGELYNHDYREKFEELTSFIRSATPKPGHTVVQYWVYDYVVGDTPGIGALDFSQRSALIEALKNWKEEKDYAPNIVFVDTAEVDDEEAMIAVFGTYLSYGFEGLMIRNARGIYKNKRSYDLQKVKVMADAEFEVIDVTEGRGKMAGLAMFHCLTPEGKEFRVKMVGALDSLAHYYDNKSDYIGRQLTVKFQNLSAEGIPRFPIALRFREDV